MNVIELLANELKNKDWSLEEKQRHIYLRTCQIFSFDPKYNLCKKLSEYQKLQQEMRDKAIDLTNVTDFNVVCTSYSKQVISVLLEELLNIKTTLQGNDHHYITSSINDKIFKVDGTLNDIFRVKMNIDTTGYYLLPKNDCYKEELIRIDKKIGYLKDIYGNKFIKEKKTEILNLTNNIRNYSDFFIFMMNKINKLYQLYNTFDNFSDAKFCVDYLILHLFNDYDREYIKDEVFFLNNDSKDWDYVKLYVIDLDEDILYWALEKQNNSFCLHEITENQAKCYKKEMKGIDRGYIKDV